MGLFLVYTIKSAICLLLFFVFNRVILSKETFHRVNRMVWLSVMVLSLTIPAMDWSVLGVDEQLILAVSTSEPLMMMLGESVVSSEASIPSHYISYIVSGIVVIYLLVAALLLVRMIVSYVSVINLIRTRRKNKVSQKYLDMLRICKVNMDTEMNINLVVHSDNIAPLSWMNYILISKSDLDGGGGYHIISHEIAHIKEYDSLDVIFLNLLTVFQWFNPASWLCKRALKEVHEYNADNLVIDSGVNGKEYQLLLIRKAVGQQYHSITNNFNHSTLKNRITMMLKEKSNRWAKAKCLYAIPLALCTVAVFANQEVTDSFSELSKIESSTIFATSETVDQSKIVADVTKEVDIVQKPQKKEVVKVLKLTPARELKEKGNNGETIFIVPTFGKEVQDNVIYPSKAKDAKIEGKVVVGYAFKDDGSITSIKVIESPDQSLSDEVIRVMRAFENHSSKHVEAAKGKNLKVTVRFKL